MTFQNCPACSERVLNDAVFCSNCGHRLEIAERFSPAQKSSKAAAVQSNAWFRCPKCASEDVKALPFVAASGTSSIAFSTVIVGASAHGIAIASGATSGLQKTALAAAVAEPQPQAVQGELLTWSLGCGGVLATLIVAAMAGAAGSNVLIAGVVFSSGAAIVASAAAQAKASDWNKFTYPRIHEKWLRSLMCMRCGRVTDANELGYHRSTP